MIFPQDGSRIKVVIPDGTGALVPHGIPTSPTIPWASDVTWKFAVVHSDGTPYLLTGTALQITFKKDPDDISALVSRQASVTNASGGLCEIVTSSALSDRDLLTPRSYFMDAAFTSATSIRDEGLLPTRIEITGVVTFPTYPVTVPPSSPPLGSGPPGLPTSITTYSNAVTYAQGQGVTFSIGGINSTYLAISNPPIGTPPTNATYWLLIVSGGDSQLANNTLPGIQPALAAVAGAVPVDTGSNSQTQRRLTQDDIDPGFSILSFSGGGAVKELGDTVVNPSFTASYTTTPASAQIADGINSPLVLVTPFTSGTESHTYSKNTPNATVVFTLTAVGATTKTATQTDTWQQRTYYGVATPGTIDNAFVQALPSSGLSGGFGGVYAIGAGSNTKKAYLAFDAALGSPTIFKDNGTGFAVPFSLVASISVVNGFAITRTYSVWASDNLLNSAFNLLVA